MPSDNYELERRTNAVIVRMVDHVPFPPTAEERDELLQVITETDIAVVDLSATRSLGTRWLRFFAELTEKAELATRRFRVAAASAELLKTADYIGLARDLRAYDDVDEALQE